MNDTRTCPQCEREFTPKAKHQIYESQECRQQGWVEKEVNAAQADVQRVEADVLHLGEARDGRLREPTDCERLATALVARHTTGIHSHEIRKLGISGNPSQRVADLEALGYEIRHEREHKGRRPTGAGGR